MNLDSLIKIAKCCKKKKRKRTKCAVYVQRQGPMGGVVWVDDTEYAKNPAMYNKPTYDFNVPSTGVPSAYSTTQLYDAGRDIGNVLSHDKYKPAANYAYNLFTPGADQHSEALALAHQYADALMEGDDRLANYCAGYLPTVVQQNIQNQVETYKKENPMMSGIAGTGQFRDQVHKHVNQGLLEYGKTPLHYGGISVPGITWYGTKSTPTMEDFDPNLEKYDKSKYIPGLIAAGVIPTALGALTGNMKGGLGLGLLASLLYGGYGYATANGYMNPIPFLDNFSKNTGNAFSQFRNGFQNTPGGFNQPKTNPPAPAAAPAPTTPTTTPAAAPDATKALSAPKQ